MTQFETSYTIQKNIIIQKRRGEKKMKKRFLGLLAVAFLGVFLLASCGKTYLVSFEEEGGSEVADVEVKEGELVTLPAAPTKEGLTFDGWYLDPNCREAFDASKPVVEELVLYAKWSVKLTFDSKGGSAVEAIVAKGSSVYELPANPTREGFAFVGWFTDEACTKALPALVFPAKNTTAYAKWLALDTTTKVDIKTWAPNDANAFDVDGTKFTATEAKGEWTMVISEFKVNLAGYDTLVVDMVGSEGTEIMFKFEGDGVKATEQTFVLTGKDQRIIWNFGTETLAGTGVGTGKIGFFLAPGKAGTVEEKANTEVVDKYVEIKAAGIYRALEEGKQNKDVAITYISNGGSAVAAQFVAKGAKATAPTAPTKAGYVFDGWYVDPEFTDEYDWETAVNENISLYAKWEKGSYKVTFDVNDHGTAPAELNVGYLPILPKLKADGFAFKGWFYDEELTKPANAKDEIFGDLTLYAKWVEGSPLPVKVDMLADTFVPNDHCSSEVKDGALVVKKNDGSPYESIASTLTVSDIEGMDALVVEFKGAAGQEVIFKVGDYWECEKKVVCTGEVQRIVYEFNYSKLPVANKALIIMPGVANDGTASGELEITVLEFIRQ